MIKSNKGGFILPLVVVVIAALAIGGGVYYSQQNPPAAEPVVDTTVNADTSSSFTTTAPDAMATTTATSTASTTVSAESSTSGTLGSLFAIAGNLKCTFSSTGAGASAGTVYLAGDMVRGDFTLQGQATGEAHLLRKGSEVYVWSGAQGAKMTTSALTGNETKQKAGLDLEQTVSYRCDPWTKEDSRFVAPTTVNFIDVAAMMSAQTGINTNR